MTGRRGCGKSVLARSIMRLVRPPGRTVAGEILYHPSETANGDSPIDLAKLD